MNIPPQVLLVTGGYDDHINRLDTTEFLRPGSDWQVITSARLPRKMYGLRVATVDNRVFLFGEWNISCNLHPPSHSPMLQEEREMVVIILRTSWS